MVDQGQDHVNLTIHDFSPANSITPSMSEHLKKPGHMFHTALLEAPAVREENEEPPGREQSSSLRHGSIHQAVRKLSSLPAPHHQTLPYPCSHTHTMCVMYSIYSGVDTKVDFDLTLNSCRELYTFSLYSRLHTRSITNVSHLAQSHYCG